MYTGGSGEGPICDSTSDQIRGRMENKRGERNTHARLPALLLLHPSASLLGRSGGNSDAILKAASGPASRRRGRLLRVEGGGMKENADVRR